MIPIIITADDKMITKKVRFPIILSTVSLSFFPIARESTDPEPTPSKTAIALLINTNGDAAETALMASVPTVCPT